MSNKNKIHYSFISELIFWGGIAFLVISIGSFFLISFLFGLELEQMQHHNYSESTIEQLQGNLPIYFKKIQKQLEAHNLPPDIIWIDEEDYDNISCDVEFKDSNLHIYAVCFSDDSEEIYIWYKKKYSHFKQLVDLKPPVQDEYGILCAIAESMLSSEYHTTHTETTAHLLEEIFDEGELRKRQEEFDSGKDIEITRYKTFKKDSDYLSIYLYSSKSEDIILEINCNLTFHNDGTVEK